MRIAVDARPLCIEQASGIPTYLRCLLHALSEIDHENEYVLYAHRDFNWQGAPGFRWSKHVGTKVYGTVWMQTVVPFWIQQDKIDVFWGTQHILPLPAPRRVKMVLTVHDLIYLRMPQTMEIKNLWINRAMIGPSIRRADVIATDSAWTARDVVDLMRIDPKNLHVVHLGVEKDYRFIDKVSAGKTIREKLNQEQPFLLTVGTMEPRKNLIGCLSAFSRLTDRSPHVLCVVGPPGWKMKGILKKVQNHDVNMRVRWLGYVPRDLMPELYAASDMFLFPSLYEGFGLPPLEAMACGTPVISSNRSCLPEILGNAAVFVDPLNDAAMSLAMERILSDREFNRELVQKGIKWVSRFQWPHTARRMLDLFQEAVR